MSIRDVILAGGGGGSGGYYNTPDNLRSTDQFEVLLGLGSGRFQLAPGGLQNLYVNGIAVEDATGKPTFKEFTAVLWDGDPAIIKPVKLALGESAGQTTVGLGITNPYPSQPGDWVYAAVTQAGAEFIDIRIVVESLYTQNKSGMGNATATLEIELLPSNGTAWINPLLDTSAPTYNKDGNPITTPDGNGSGGDGGTSSPVTVYSMYSAYGGPQWQSVGDAAYVDLSSGETTYYSPSPGQIKISGKTTSAYVKELRIAVPNKDAYANVTWQVRIRLIEQDDVLTGSNNNDEVKRTLSWESIAGGSTAQIGNNEDWRGLSWLQIFGKATDQINNIPEVVGVYDVDLFKVPPSTVWDPDTRVYTGATWDGATYQLAHTACPAWQIKKIIEDPLFGVAALAPGSTMNKWDVLEASKWFAETVTDGAGGSRPRYSLNWYNDQPKLVSELINYLAGAVGAFCWDEGGGNWRMKVEKPETPAMIFTKENIVGEFNYQHTDVDSRFNDITAKFQNKDRRYADDRVRLFNSSNISSNGRRPTTIELVGCTNRSEAIYRTALRLITSLNETRMVTFQTNRQGQAGMLEFLSVIGVADGDLNGSETIRSTGRVTSISADRLHITVRDPLRLEAGTAYQIQLTYPNPNYTPDTTTEPASDDWRKPTITFTANVTNTAAQRGDVTDIYLDAALPANTPEFAVVALSATGLPALPKQYRVLSIQPDDSNPEIVTITASEIYTNKWNEAEAAKEGDISTGISGSTGGESGGNGNDVEPPVAPAGNHMLKIVQHQSTYATMGQYLQADWGRPSSAQRVAKYRIERRLNGGNWIPLGFTTTTVWEMADPPEGLHEFRVFTVAPDGRESLPLYDSLDVGAVIEFPSMTLTADDISFDYIDGVALSSAQVITITAKKQNTDEALTWSASPNVTLGGAGDSRTISIADFGSNMSVVVTAVGQTSGVEASITIIRKNMTTPSDSIIPDSGFQGVPTTAEAGGSGATWRRSGSIRMVSV